MPYYDIYNYVVLFPRGRPAIRVIRAIRGPLSPVVAILERGIIERYYILAAAQYIPALLMLKGFIFVYRLAEDGSLL